ncbi:transglutaminase superfamily protein [Leucobacter luti]|uniref:Transglutaminase superfamily protein n=2 Tax=Leucobacter luti TaxID=340320 RepID=A0A4V3CXN7_9MICO|nr:transglutaminase superfamily protein [Leucobacter luti]
MSPAGMRARATPAQIVWSGVLAVAIGILAAGAAWPIYRSEHLWLLIAGATGAAYGVVLAGRLWRWGSFTAGALLLGFVVLLVPLAVPDALLSGAAGIPRGLGDGLAAVALGWKQVLTLTLPLGTYQAVLVPVFVLVYASVAASTWLALRDAKSAVWAALPAAAVVGYGTVFGPAELSEPLLLGSVTVTAPRELAVWIAAGIVIACWISWTSGAARRAALRLGRESRARRRSVTRGAIGAGIVVLALSAAAVLAPAAATTPRSVPRDRIDPVVVVREQTSPLASYRVWKRDAAFEAPLFTVSSAGKLPGRLRLAVLDHSNGIDFTVSVGPGTFTRYPSGGTVADPTQIRVEIAAGYSGIWVPLTTELAATPRFAGPRAAELSDGFYLDRDTGAGIAVPTAAGLRSGDEYTVELSAAPDAQLGGAPARATPDLDLSELPQLDRWLGQQSLPSSGEGLETAIERLRERGYLSHALSDQNERLWLDELAAEYGTRFVASSGGHSTARTEELFTQLNEQQEAAGADADDAALVSGIGDDEQFAAAAVQVARAMGFDARVVLGVRMGEAGVPGVPACEQSCTGANVAAWIEARGADGVWAPIDVTPQVATPPVALDSGERLPEHATVPEELDAPESDPEFGSGAGDSVPSQTTGDTEPSSWWPIVRWAGLGIVALVLLAVLVLFIPVVKRVRSRSRRGSGTVETRVLGAWEELLDAHADAGTPEIRAVRAARSTPTASRRDLGALIPGGLRIAAEVDHAVFSGEGADPDAADRVWASVDAELAGLRAGRSRWARLAARYSLASFGIARLARAGQRQRAETESR